MRPVDTVVVGGGASGLVVAVALARGGSKVVVVERSPALGGALREIEFAPGFKAAPLAGDLGWIPPEVARGLGITLGATVAPAVSVATADGSGGWLEFKSDPAATAAGIRKYSAKDADKWAAFTTRVHKISGFLGALYVAPPPRIDADSLGEFFELLKLGRKLKGLGNAEMIEVLRTIPMSVAELLDDWFESDVLKGAVAANAITDICQGPMGGGTAFNLLHNHVGLAAGAIRGRPVPAEGGTGLVRQLADLARSVGVEIMTGVAVRQVLVANDRVSGVGLESGDQIGCREVVSSLDPYQSLLGLVDPVHLDPDVIRAVRTIRFRGVVSKVMVALDGLPPLPTGSAGLGAISISPSIRYLERAFDATKYGHSSAAPYVEVRFPSVDHPELAPSGKHVAILHVQYTPYQLRAGSWGAAEKAALGDLAVATVDQALPGFSGRVLHRTVLAPPDIETEFGLREGAINQGEMTLDQILFMRPIAGWSRYATPVPGLFLCGSGTHPGGGVTGASGWLAAQAVLKARK